MAGIDLSRDWKIIAPIIGVALVIASITVPNAEPYLPQFFAFASILVGFYGATKGTGSGEHSENTFGLHSGMFRFVLGVVCLALAFIAIGIQASNNAIMAIFGIAGELIGVSVPALAQEGK